MPTRCIEAATCSGIRRPPSREGKPDKPDRTSGPPPALLRPSRSQKSPTPECASEPPISSWARVFPLLCEIRHIALPRIDLLCCFSLDCDPSPMTCPFFRNGHLP